MTILFVTGTRHIDHPTDNPPDGRIFATSTLLKIPRHDPTGATQQAITADVATAAGNTGADTTTADMIRMTMINKTCKCGCHDAGHAQWTKAKYGLAVEAYVEHIKSEHLGNRYSCTYEDCDKEYTRKERLKPHVNSVHLKISFDCICGTLNTRRSGIPLPQI